MFKFFSKKLIFIFIVTAFNLIIGLRTSIGFFYLFFWFSVAILATGFIWVSLEYLGTKLSLTRDAIRRLEEDDTLKIEVVIKNRGFVPIFNLVLHDYLPCAAVNEADKSILIDYLGPRASRRIKYSCFCSKRGKYVIGPIVIYFFDPFGLFFFRKTHYLYCDIFVYPKTFSIRRFPPLAKGNLPWFGIETTHTSGDEDEFFGVREYKEGDPIKRIHWISTARKNRLIVKQFQRQSYFRATIIFDLEKDKNFGEGKESIAEYIIKIAASIASYLIDNDISVEIIAHTGEIVHIPFNKGPEHLEDIMKFLTIAKPESRISLDEIFQEYSRYIPDNSSLIVIMLDKDWEHLPKMLPLGKRNVFLVPLILLSSSFTYTFDKQAVLIDAKQKISQMVNFKPIIFSKGDNLERIFLEY